MPTFSKISTVIHQVNHFQCTVMHILKYMVLFADLIDLNLITLYTLFYQLLLFPNNMSWGSFCNFKWNLKVQVQEKGIPRPAEGRVNWCIFLLDNLLCLLKDAHAWCPSNFPAQCLSQRNAPPCTKKVHSSTSSSRCCNRTWLNQNIYSIECSAANIIFVIELLLTWSL